MIRAHARFMPLISPSRQSLLIPILTSGSRAEGLPRPAARMGVAARVVKGLVRGVPADITAMKPIRSKTRNANRTSLSLGVRFLNVC